MSFSCLIFVIVVTILYYLLYEKSMFVFCMLMFRFLYYIRHVYMYLIKILLYKSLIGQC